MAAFASSAQVAHVPVAPADDRLQEAEAAFRAGRYQTTLTLLEGAASPLGEGFLAYWRGMTANRLGDHAAASRHFADAIARDYRPSDIYYEQGQALFALADLELARQAFAESLRRGHLRGPSLYYLGHLSRALNDHKNAVVFFQSVENLPASEASPVLQAAQGQMAELYLAQVEDRPDASSMAESYVLPQFRRALATDPHSPLAPVLRARIKDLEQRYELFLHHMRNGRPTPVPRHHLSFLQGLSYDSNPVYAPTETTNSPAKRPSVVSRSEAFGKQTFFYRNIWSFTPELRMHYTRHLERAKHTRRNDHWVIAPAMRAAFEHDLGRLPAALLTELEHAYSHRNREAAGEMKFNARATTAAVGERITGLWGPGDTSLRLRHRRFESYYAEGNSRSVGVGLEHVLPRPGGALWVFSAAHDRTWVEAAAFDTETIYLRSDVSVPVGSAGLTVAGGLGLAFTDPTNARASRGQERTYQPSLRLSWPVEGKWLVSLHAEHVKHLSRDRANFTYEKTVSGVEFGYTF